VNQVSRGDLERWFGEVVGEVFGDVDFDDVSLPRLTGSYGRVKYPVVVPGTVM
jgi:hypothetical protein